MRYYSGDVDQSTGKNKARWTCGLLLDQNDFLVELHNLSLFHIECKYQKVVLMNETLKNITL